MASSIGIKIANGEFYPLVEENSLIKKRLILTTVHDDQPSVQIDLFRSPENVMADAQYIGTVVVENIRPRPKGEPSIEMVISSDKNGDIIADAIDLDASSNGEHYVLTVSLKSIDDISKDMEIQDFELESNEEPPSGLYHHAKEIRQDKKSSFKPWVFILILLLLLLGLLAAWLFFMGGLETARSWFNKPAASVTQSAPAPAPEPAPAPTPVLANDPEPQPVITSEPEPVSEPVQQVVEAVPVIQAPAAPPAPRQQGNVVRANNRVPPVFSFNVPETIPREGVSYVIRWGDTLWDIADAFYRDPWQYPRIARHNNISNPNLIISGRTIRVPPRN
ncbi:MAG: LysM peptidoglycan-binding domain-containing protein [Treponema sp.]|nr:LysM peptidoglycan-binding domain-containing protein [Treponema sp.]